MNGFGRCIVCGNLVAEQAVETPSRLRWHLRQNATGYVALLLLVLSYAVLPLFDDTPTHALSYRSWTRIPAVLASPFFLHWLHKRLMR